jgi:hypothetical protein
VIIIIIEDLQKVQLVQLLAKSSTCSGSFSKMTSTFQREQTHTILNSLSKRTRIEKAIETFEKSVKIDFFQRLSKLKILSKNHKFVH